MRRLFKIGQPFLVSCLNHDFSKIFKINRIFYNNLGNLENLTKIMVQD